MLSKVSIQNFRNFSDKYIFDLTSKKNYEFNDFAVRENIVKHSIVYGKNGCGKSNLGLAILDITTNIAPDDLVRINTINDSYINADNSSSIAEFEFIFIFSGIEVVYTYGKSSPEKIVYEKLTIKGKTVLEVDKRTKSLANYFLKGTESLVREIPSDSMSIIRYVSRNSILDMDIEENKIFIEFIDFVNSMVFFRTLNRGPEHYGPRIDVKRLSLEIINKEKVDDFEEFLNEAGIKCRLKVQGEGEDKRIEFKFKNTSIEFSKVASTGTHSLGVFYYWWLQLESEKFNFAFIDEFDAFYHYELSELLVKKINSLKNCQTILTTHNIALLNNKLLRPDCFFEMTNEKMFFFYELVDKDLRRAHNLEKIYKGIHSG